MPRWVSRLVHSGEMPLPLQGPGRHRIGVLRTRAAWTSRMLEVKTKHVCRSCNNGWMATLENEAKPVLSRMVRGERCLLDPSEQALVSTWALKAALMSELIWPDRDSLIPSEHYKYIREHSRSPESSRIWCGAHWPTPFDARFAAAFEHAYQLHFEADGDPHIGYTVMVGIGHVAFQVLGHTGPGDFTSGRKSSIDRRRGGHGPLRKPRLSGRHRWRLHTTAFSIRRDLSSIRRRNPRSARQSSRRGLARPRASSRLSPGSWPLLARCRVEPLCGLGDTASRRCE